MESTQIVEYVFKGVISLSVGLIIYILKDFKLSLTELTKSLITVNLSLNSLLANDKHRDVQITEIKKSMENMQEDIKRLNDKMHHIEVTHGRDLLELKYKVNIRE